MKNLEIEIRMKGNNNKMTGIVITADVIGSSKLTQLEKKKMLHILKESTKTGQRLMPDLVQEIFQGDSIQGVSRQGIRQGLRHALQIMTMFRMNDLNIRVAVGIGEIHLNEERVALSDGPAFVRSGRGLEGLKKKAGNFLSIATGDADRDAEWNVHCLSLNYLYGRCTPLQAQALFHSLNDQTQTQIGRKLKITQPTVQQRLQAAGWPVIKAMIGRFESLY
ncbi:MAG TPA: hypothetical protein VK907_08545 [Phnomibacter sp.]|nr:hypothetical protein [Phnomibacter sp.]